MAEPSSSNPVVSVTGELARPAPVPMTVTDAGPFRPAGMTSDFRLPSGTDGVLSNVRAALQEMQNTASTLEQVAQRTRQFLGDAVGIMERSSLAGAAGGAAAARGGDLKELVAAQQQTAKYTRRMVEVISGEALVEGAGAPRGGGGGGVGPRVVSRAPGRAPAGRGAPGEGEVGPGPGGRVIPTGWTQVTHMTEGAQASDWSIGNIRQRAGTAVLKRIEGRWPEVIKPTTVAEGETPSYLRRLREGETAPAGSAAPAGWVHATEEDVHKASSLGRVRSGIGAVAEGGDMMGVLRAAAPELLGAVGLVGLAPDAFRRATRFVSDQREQNARYQQILGGSNFAGYGQRATENTFAFRNLFSGISSQMSEQMFNQVTELGMQGAQRQQYLGFATRAFKEMGITPDELQPIMQTASETGQNLNTLEAALQGVSTAAATAGVNAQTARRGFLQVFNAAAAVAPGTAPTAAAAAQQSITQLGRPFQGVSAAGQFGDEQQRLQAAAAGLTFEQFQVRTSAPGAAGVLFGARARQGLVNQRASQLLGPQGMAAARQAIAALGIRPGATPTEDQLRQIQTAISAATGGSVDPSMAVQMMQNAGLTGANEGNAIALAALNATGITSQVTAARSAVNTNQSFRVNAANLRNLQSGARPGGTDRIMGLMNQAGINLGTFGGRGVLGVARGTDAIDTGQKGDQEQFARNLLRGGGGMSAGQFSPTVARLVATNDPSRRYRVKTGNGDRVVTLGEGLKYYADQFAKGDVQIEAGTDAGQTVAQATNSMDDPSIKVRTARVKGGVGETIKDWNKDASSGGPNSGKVVVTADPNLNGIIKLMTSGSIVTQSPLAPPAQPQPTGPYTTVGQ